MSNLDLARATHRAFVLAVIGGLAGMGQPCPGLAHENHAPLPTKGVTIRGDQILLSAQARRAIGLATAKVTLGDVRRVIRVHAQVELPWRQQAMITSLVPGKIDETLVRPGEMVAAGQALARLSSLELESLQRDFLRADAEKSLAERLAGQRKSLAQSGTIAGKALLEAEAALTEKVAQRAIARQKLAALGLDDETLKKVLASGQTVDRLTIASPIAGAVTHADVRAGQIIHPTDHLYHVVDLRTVWLVGEALEADCVFVKKGQPVTAMFAAQPERPLRGQVDHLRLRLDNKTRTQAVVIAVDNSSGVLRPGMFGRMDIEVHVAKEAVFCPADALIESRSGVHVLVERGEGKYVSQPVKLGMRREGRVEILDGVFPGDKVVVVGNYLLASLLGNEHKARVPADPAARISPTPVPQATALRAPVVVQATVELPTDRQVFATARIEGRVGRILVEPAQAVRAGQVLAEIESLSLRTVQLDLLLALTKMRTAAASLSRLEGLNGRGATAQRQLWQLQSDVQTLRQTVESLKRQLAALGLTAAQITLLESADLTKPDAQIPIVNAVPVCARVDGWLVGSEAVPGRVVAPQEKLFEIQDLSKVWAKGYVFEHDAALVQVGQQVEVTFSAHPEWKVAGKVVRIAPSMETAERVLPVWIEIDNADLRLKEGMLARVSLTSTDSAGASTARHRSRENVGAK